MICARSNSDRVHIVAETRIRLKTKTLKNQLSSCLGVVSIEHGHVVDLRTYVD